MFLRQFCNICIAFTGRGAVDLSLVIASSPSPCHSTPHLHPAIADLVTQKRAAKVSGSLLEKRYERRERNALCNCGVSLHSFKYTHTLTQAKLVTSLIGSIRSEMHGPSDRGNLVAGHGPQTRKHRKWLCALSLLSYRSDSPLSMTSHFLLQRSGTSFFNLR